MMPDFSCGLLTRLSLLHTRQIQIVVTIPPTACLFKAFGEGVAELASR